MALLLARGGELGRTIAHTYELREAYVDIDEVSHHAGRSMGKNDLWIAATARATAAPLLTTDKDFEHLHPEWLTLAYCDPARAGR